MSIFCCCEKIGDIILDQNDMEIINKDTDMNTLSKEETINLSINPRKVPSKMGWIVYISKSLLVSIPEKVYAVLLDGYLLCYINEISASETYGKGKKGLSICMDLTGGNVRTSSNSFGKSFNITISSVNMTIELDANGFSYQDEWIVAIRREIESANTNIILQGDYELNSGVVDWIKSCKQNKESSISRLRLGTPMTKHYLLMGSRYEHERVLSLDASGTTVSWKDPRASEGSEKDILVLEIDEIWEGTRTKVLESLTQIPSRAACCWTIIARAGKSIDFEAQAVEEKNRWVDNLRILVKVAKLEESIRMRNIYKSSKRSTGKR